MARLPRSFYTRPDVVHIARELIGTVLHTRLRGAHTAGLIVETEAYAGPEDRASHAYQGRRTARTEIMYARGGTAYVYLCYGVHSLFNVVTNTEGVPHAILIRAVEPVQGLAIMLRRRGLQEPARRLTAGPGALAQALGIRVADSGEDLLGERIWIEGSATSAPRDAILASPRVGVAYAGAHRHRPWRFRLKGSPWTSPAP